MRRPWEISARIADEQVIAVVRSPDAESAAGAADLLLASGLGVVEVSLTTRGALDVIAGLARSAPPEAVIGAGTVLDAASARQAILAGAVFLVSPTLSTEVIMTAARYGVVTVVGCSTPTEMITAIERGATFCKVFPASLWTPDDLRQVLAALPQLPLIPTGGIAVEDAGAWLAAGASAIGLGSTLTGGTRDQILARVDRLRASLERGPDTQS